MSDKTKQFILHIFDFQPSHNPKNITAADVAIFVYVVLFFLPKCVNASTSVRFSLQHSVIKDYEQTLKAAAASSTGTWEAGPHFSSLPVSGGCVRGAG